METLVPAFILALIAQFCDRPAYLIAALADRYDRRLTVAIAAWLALSLGLWIAAAGAQLIAPMLNPDAQQLLLSLSLLFAAAGALWRQKKPDMLEGWKLGAWLTSFLGVFILAFGDTAQFITFALATKGLTYWFAFAGASFAALIIAFVAAMAGAEIWNKLPITPIRVTFGILCAGAGAVIGAAALGLI